MDCPPPPSQPPVDPLQDPTVRTTRRLDLAAATLGSAVLVVFELGPAIAKRAYDATDFEVALVTSGQCVGLLLSFFVAHFATTHRKSPLVVWPELLARLIIASVFFVKPTFALAFVILHMGAQMFQQMTLPARVTIYRLNYPVHIRGRIVAHNRQTQLVFTVILSLAMSVSLDWSDGRAELVALLGESPIDVGLMINFLLPASAAFGILGTLFFSLIPVRGDDALPSSSTRGGMVNTARQFVRVWRQDHGFRRLQVYWFIFGFSSTMALPLISIHAVDVFHANYFDLALINVVILQVCMAISLPFWGKVVDRHSPARLRAILNLILSLDLLALAISPSLGWIYAGRVCRGLAMGGGTLLYMLASLYYARSKDDVPVYLGIHTFLTGIRWAIAPFAGVFLKELFQNDARPIFALTFGVIFISSIFLLRASRHDPPPRLEGPPMPSPRNPAS